MRDKRSDRSRTPADRDENMTEWPDVENCPDSVRKRNFRKSV